MAFTSITTAEIQVGEPTAQPLFQKIKDDLDDHESRIAAAEVGASSRPPIEFGVWGLLPDAYAADGVEIYRTPLNISMLGARVLVNKAGSSGTLTVDVEYKRGAGAWTSILSVPISVTSAAGDLSLTSGVLTVTNFLTGDLFRLNVDSVQVGMSGFTVLLENEVA
jgi:hypothetical protein